MFPPISPKIHILESSLPLAMGPWYWEEEETLLPFLGFALFINYQNEHARHFRGASQRFYMLLISSVVLGWITGLVYLVWLGFAARWWSPFAFFGAGTL